MFRRKKEKEKNMVFFETKDYQMKYQYPASSLLVGNLEYVSNQEEMPTVVRTNQKYLFELVEDEGKLKYREVFTGFVTEGEKECVFFNLPYVVEPIALKEVLPDVSEHLTKFALLLALDEINFKAAKQDDVCVIFKDEEEEQTFSEIASDINQGIDPSVRQKIKKQNEIKHNND